MRWGHRSGFQDSYLLIKEDAANSRVVQHQDKIVARFREHDLILIRSESPFFLFKISFNNTSNLLIYLVSASPISYWISTGTVLMPIFPISETFENYYLHALQHKFLAFAHLPTQLKLPLQFSSHVPHCSIHLSVHLSKSPATAVSEKHDNNETKTRIIFISQLLSVNLIRVRAQSTSLYDQ